MMCSQEPLRFALPALENRFTPDELNELLSFFQPLENAFYMETHDENVSRNSGSDVSTAAVDGEMDEKLKKRKISNRESARRSRGRKKRYLEDLTAQVNQLKAKNREYKNRLSMVFNQLHAVKMQNELIRLESMHLIQSKEGLNRVLQAMQYSHSPTYENNIITR